MLATLIRFLLSAGLTWSALSVVHAANAANIREHTELGLRIENGEAAEVFRLAQKAVEVDPDSWPANDLRWRALVALSRPDDAEAGLVRWADRNRSDPSRAEALLDYYETTKRWDRLAAMTSWLTILPEPGRVEELRSTIDRLCGAGQCELAAAPVRELIPHATEPARTAIVRALDAVGRKDIKGMLAELPAFPPVDDPGSRTEARILVSRRAAAIRKDLPTTGGVAPESLTKRPELVGKVKPIYPDGARRAKIEGHVIVRALVLPSGEVLVTGVLSWNNPMFIDSAAEAVAQWTYKPGTIEGKPAAVDYVIRVDYWMENDPATKATRTP